MNIKDGRRLLVLDGIELRKSVNPNPEELLKREVFEELVELDIIAMPPHGESFVAHTPWEV